MKIDLDYVLSAIRLIELKDPEGKDISNILINVDSSEELLAHMYLIRDSFNHLEACKAVISGAADKYGVGASTPRTRSSDTYGDFEKKGRFSEREEELGSIINLDTEKLKTIKDSKNLSSYIEELMYGQKISE